jgi:fumarate reductase flavoprotein subunit
MREWPFRYRRVTDLCSKLSIDPLAGTVIQLLTESLPSALDRARRSTHYGQGATRMVRGRDAARISHEVHQVIAETGSRPEGWDDAVDIVVVGSGFAGLAAAAAAASAGSSVMIIEKMAHYGGNSAINLGDYASWDDARHRRAALGLGDDSAEQHAADALAAGQDYGDPELVATISRAAPSALDWMVADGGLRLHAALHRQGGGGFRMHFAGGGRDFVEALRAIALQHGAAVRTGAKLARIWRDGAGGPVTGIAFTTADCSHNIAARKAVVLATGGFGADVAMRRAFRPILTAAYNTTNHPGATGEAIRLAQAIGADTLHLAFIEVHPFGHPETGALDVAARYALRLRRQGGIIVSRAGKRFVNEMAPHDAISRAALATGERPVYAVFNEAMLQAACEERTDEEIATALAQGLIVRAPTLVELGAVLGIPGKAIEASAQRFAAFLGEGRDQDFARLLTPALLRLDAGPYYGIPRWPAVHFTAGGLRIDTRARVIDINGAPISRLYAAGEVTGGIHGMGRTGGNSTTAPIVFGRIAGTEAAALGRREK